jgi:hypothetical protein
VEAIDFVIQQEERFANARAAYVAHHQHRRRPGATLAGFLSALAPVPMPVPRVLAFGVRQRIGVPWAESLRLKAGWLPLACDGRGEALGYSMTPLRRFDPLP